MSLISGTTSFKNVGIVINVWIFSVSANNFVGADRRLLGFVMLCFVRLLGFAMLCCVRLLGCAMLCCVRLFGCAMLCCVRLLGFTMLCADEFLRRE